MTSVTTERIVMLDGTRTNPANGGVHLKQAYTVTWLSGLSLPVSSAAVVFPGGHANEPGLVVGSTPVMVHRWSEFKLPSALTCGASGLPPLVRYPDQQARKDTSAGLTPQMLARPAPVRFGHDGGGSHGQ